MKNRYLKLVDVNLSLFSIDSKKKKVFIEILNMDNGSEVCTINITNIMELQYKNNIDEKDILPAFIGELEISKSLNNEIYYLKMQGWVDVFLVCANCTINYPHTIQQIQSKKIQFKIENGTKIRLDMIGKKLKW